MIATIEGKQRSDLSFRKSGIISDIHVTVGESVKKWQILARIGNTESYIQHEWLSNISDKLWSLIQTTESIQIKTEWMKKTTEKLYNSRVEELDTQIQALEIEIEKARINLGNQTEWRNGSFITFANDFDRIASSMLFEGDRILGITNQFEHANDGWEAYIWARAGSSQVEAKNNWNKLYSARGIIRTYTQTGATVNNINQATRDLSQAYIATRNMVQSMNFMLENSVIGWGLPEEQLNWWLTLWKSMSADNQNSESAYISWKNAIKSITSEDYGSWSVAEKDIESLIIKQDGLKIMKNTLLAEKEAKLQEIGTNIVTVEGKKWEVGIQLSQTIMNQKLSQESLEYGIIRAPYDGIILERYGDEWEMIGAGIPLYRMTENNSKLLKVYIDNDLYQYTLWQRVNLETEDKFALTGSIALIQKEKDPLHNKNYIEIELDTEEPIGSKITIHLKRIKTSYENGIIIPLSSIITRYGPPGVYMVRDGIARFQMITLLWSDETHAEVLWIPSDARIITEGKENIYDGEHLE